MLVVLVGSVATVRRIWLMRYGTWHMGLGIAIGLWPLPLRSGVWQGPGHPAAGLLLVMVSVEA